MRSAPIVVVVLLLCYTIQVLAEPIFYRSAQDCPFKTCSHVCNTCAVSSGQSVYDGAYKLKVLSLDVNPDPIHIHKELKITYSVTSSTVLNNPYVELNIYGPTGIVQFEYNICDEAVNHGVANPCPLPEMSTPYTGTSTFSLPSILFPGNYCGYAIFYDGVTAVSCFGFDFTLNY